MIIPTELTVAIGDMVKVKETGEVGEVKWVYVTGGSISVFFVSEQEKRTTTFHYTDLLVQVDEKCYKPILFAGHAVVTVSDCTLSSELKEAIQANGGTIGQSIRMRYLSGETKVLTQIWTGLVVQDMEAFSYTPFLLSLLPDQVIRYEMLHHPPRVTHYYLARSHRDLYEVQDTSNSHNCFIVLEAVEKHS